MDATEQEEVLSRVVEQNHSSTTNTNNNDNDTNSNTNSNNDDTKDEQETGEQMTGSAPPSPSLNVSVHDTVEDENSQEAPPAENGSSNHGSPERLSLSLSPSPKRRSTGRRVSHSSLLSWGDDDVDNDVDNDDHRGNPGVVDALLSGAANNDEDTHVYDEVAERVPMASISTNTVNAALPRSISDGSLVSWNGSADPRNVDRLLDELDDMSGSSYKRKRKKGSKCGKVRWKSTLPKRRTSANDNDDNTSSQGGSFAGVAKKGIWTRMARKTSVWDEGDEGKGEEYGLSHLFRNSWTEIKVSFRVKSRLVMNHPHIPVTTFLCFLALCTGGIVITLAYAQQHEQFEKTAAINKAKEYGKWFSDQLAASALPLFAMAQFVSEVQVFQDLPTQIGTGGEDGSAPFRDPADPEGAVSHRDVRGICDDPLLLEEFNRIARNIKEAARMDRILVNLQFAPLGVVCLLYPLINREDFDPPNYLNNTGAVGLDLLKDLAQRAVAEETVKSGDLVFAGPITLRQCPDCDPVVRQAFVARLPIATNDESFEFDLNGQPYNFWGFATALINWGELVELSGLIEDFESRNQGVILARTDKLFDADSGTYYNQSVVLVESGNTHEIEEGHFANVSLRVTNNDWDMAVSFDDRWKAPFLPGAIGATIAIALIVSALLLEILVERQAHKNLISEMLPKKAMRKIQRGEIVAESYNIVTIFFSDIVGYTTMSAEMRPIKVMKLLNSFYTEVDRIAERHGVYKIETIGDAYMCVGGCPDRCLGPEGAERVALFALDMIELVKNFRTDDGSQLLVRAGINSGPAVAGVVGTTRPQYTLFGDAVNAASRMESTSEKMRIQCSDFTYRLLRDAPNYSFRMLERGHVQIKGKGHMNTWWIEGVTHMISPGAGDKPSSPRILFRRNRTAEAHPGTPALPGASGPGSTASESDPHNTTKQTPAPETNLTPSTAASHTVEADRHLELSDDEDEDENDSVSENLLMSDGGDLESIDSLDPMDRV